jgi:ABC-2 type transport system ATP-binding protein
VPLVAKRTSAETVADPAPPALRFVDVVRRYGRHVALDHLSMEIPQGETVALLGPNGAGKSTTIALFLGLLRPDAGTVQVLGLTPRQARARGLVGVMLQQATGNGLPPGVSVSAVLEMMCKLYPGSESAESLADRTGITPLLSRRTNRLSGGEAQLVRFALSIAGRPQLLFLDEPTVAMDVQARRALWRTVRAMGERGCTVIYATHHLDEVDNASRVVVVNRGRVVADGPGATLAAMASARRLRFAVDSPDESELDRLEGVTDVHLRGGQVTLDSLDADATVRDLVQRKVEFRDLEVVGGRLEDAFTTLVGGTPPHGPPSSQEAPSRDPSSGSAASEITSPEGPVGRTRSA